MQTNEVESVTNSFASLRLQDPYVNVLWDAILENPLPGHLHCAGSVILSVSEDVSVRASASFSLPDNQKLVDQTLFDTGYLGEATQSTAADFDIPFRLQIPLGFENGIFQVQLTYVDYRRLTLSYFLSMNELARPVLKQPPNLYLSSRFETAPQAADLRALDEALLSYQLPSNGIDFLLSALTELGHSPSALPDRLADPPPDPMFSPTQPTPAPLASPFLGSSSGPAPSPTLNAGDLPRVLSCLSDAMTLCSEEDAGRVTSDHLELLLKLAPKHHMAAYCLGNMASHHCLYDLLVRHQVAKRLGPLLPRQGEPPAQPTNSPSPEACFLLYGLCTPEPPEPTLEPLIPVILDHIATYPRQLASWAPVDDLSWSLATLALLPPVAEQCRAHLSAPQLGPLLPYLRMAHGHYEAFAYLLECLLPDLQDSTTGWLRTAPYLWELLELYLQASEADGEDNGRTLAAAALRLCPKADGYEFDSFICDLCGQSPGSINDTIAVSRDLEQGLCSACVAQRCPPGAVPPGLQLTPNFFLPWAGHSFVVLADSDWAVLRASPFAVPLLPWVFRIDGLDLLFACEEVDVVGAVRPLNRLGRDSLFRGQGDSQGDDDEDQEEEEDSEEEEPEEE